MQEIKITRAEQRKEKPDSSKLVFGKYMTDHMFVVDYDEGQIGRASCRERVCKQV